MAVLDLEEATAEEQHEDKELIKFFVQCFDRPAFQDRIYQEGRMEDFDKAIEDTIIALNTGVLRTRDGSILKKADGKSNPSASVSLYALPNALLFFQSSNH